MFALLIFAVLQPIVMFAGEATHKYYHSILQGAFLSGQREGDRIVHSWV